MKFRPLFNSWRRPQRKKHFPTWNICPFSFELMKSLIVKRKHNITKQKTPKKQEQLPLPQKNPNQAKTTFFSWIGQSQGLLFVNSLLKKWLPCLNVLICAYLMINNTLWTIVWCGLCWFEQENTDSLVRHLWITSVYPETINERGRFKKHPNMLNSLSKNWR